MTNEKSIGSNVGTIIVLALVISFVIGMFIFIWNMPIFANFRTKAKVGAFGQDTLVTMYGSNRTPLRGWRVKHGQIAEESGAGFDFSCNGKSVKVSAFSVAEPFTEAPALPDNLPLVVCK